ncbi:MAG: hypothetical protein KAI53_01850 [Candidatus Aenigmarchaeota archaeon]|nr:hypothetical protein [Candidatus Aenigmarchaeota archaeon]
MITSGYDLPVTPTHIMSPLITKEEYLFRMDSINQKIIDSVKTILKKEMPDYKRMDKKQVAEIISTNDLTAKKIQAWEVNQGFIEKAKNDGEDSVYFLMSELPTRMDKKDYEYLINYATKHEENIQDLDDLLWGTPEIVEYQLPPFDPANPMFQ